MGHDIQVKSSLGPLLSDCLFVDELGDAIIAVSALIFVDVVDECRALLENVSTADTLALLLGAVELIPLLWTPIHAGQSTTYLSLVVIAASLTTEVFTADAAADMIFAVDLVGEQFLIIIKILIADTAIVMDLIFMHLQFSRSLEALGAVLIGAWKSARMLRRFCSRV